MGFNARWWGVLAGLTGALLASAPNVALAHGLLRSSVPASGSTVARPPTDLLLTFTEKPEPRFTRVRLFGPQGDISLDSIRVLPEMTVGARILAPLPNGSYRVEWMTAGLDGHPVSGSYTFVVASAEAAATDPRAPASEPPGVARPAPPQTATGADPALLATLLRWLTLVGTLGVIGAVAFRATVLARVSLEVDRDIATDYLPTAARAAARLGAWSAAVVIAAALGRLAIQSRMIYGGARALDWRLTASMLLETTWGRGWVTHVVAALVALAALAVLAVRARFGGWAVAGVASLGIAMSLASVSHAAALPELSLLSAAANAVHVVAAAGWLGTLLVIFSVGLPLAMRLDREDRWTVVRDIVNSFSPAALSFGAAAVGTGVLMTWTHVRSLDNLFATDYGRVLLLKLALLAVTGIVGAYNWRRVRPSLRDQTGVVRLRASTAVELTAATLVIAVTAVLIALPLPGE